MAEEIVIKTVLDFREGAQKLRQDVGAALNSPEILTKAKEAGRKIGEGVSLGIETTRRSREEKELAHQRRLETITSQSAARIQQIEARKQAQLDLIRERGLQKEIEHQRKIEREMQRAANAAGGFRTAVAGIQSAFAGIAALGIAGLFERFARTSVDAAISVDRQVNSLRALTGSAEAAQRRFQELFKISQATPGLTSSLAATLDAQLRVFRVNERTINQLLPVIGRLNAISPLGDPRQFVNNLTQLITQNFERQDLKELIGQSPIAGQLIAGIFNVDNPTNAQAIRASARKLGITTVERLAEEMIKAAQESSALKNATDSIGSQFDKLQDRITVALAPVGAEIAKTLIPAFDRLIPLVKDFGESFSKYLRENRSQIDRFTDAIIDLTAAFGQLGKISIPIVSDLVRIAANGIGFYADLGNAIRGDFSFRNSSRNFGNLMTTQPNVIQGPDLYAPAPPPGSSLPGYKAPKPKTFAEIWLRGTNTSGGVPGGIVTGGGRARRTRGIDLPTLTESDLVTSEFEREDDFRAINAARARGRETRARLTREAELFRLGRINEGRDTRARLTDQFEAREVAEAQRLARRGLTRSGRSIGDLLGRGAITASEADALSEAANRQYAQSLREILALEQQRGKISQERMDDLQDEIELYDRLGTSISSTERFMRGFNSQIETSGDIWERFGQNVSNAFRNVRDLFNGLKSAVLGFFNDLIGNSIQNLVRSTLGPLFGGGGGGGIFGNLFRTPPFAGGGGISAPASISGATGIFANGAFGRGLSGGGSGVAGVGGALGGIFGGSGGFSLGGALGGLASAAPLLGLGLGSALGGQSTAGKILGALGGGAVGLGASFGAAVFGAGGGLAQAALAALGPAALIGAPLIVGAILLGKAKQRRSDEEASGQMLTQALQGIEQLAAAVSSGQIPTLGEARAMFENQILAQFIQGINSLKTKSVRESRLTNQVRDLRNVFESRIPPLVAEQEQRRQTAATNALNFSRQIPEFATGGTSRGGLAILHPGEKIVNLQQQSAMRAIGGSNIFEAAGVPGLRQNAIFDVGGTMGRGLDMPTVIENLNVSLLVGRDDQTRIVVNGGSTSKGRAVTVNNIKIARTNREL